jgi:hypothetical protein
MKKSYSAFALLGSALATTTGFYEYKERSKKPALARASDVCVGALIEGLKNIGLTIGKDITFERSGDDLVVIMSKEAFGKIEPQPEFSPDLSLFQETRDGFSARLNQSDFADMVLTVIKMKDSTWAGKRIDIAVTHDFWSDKILYGLECAVMGATAFKHTEEGGHSARRAA